MSDEATAAKWRKLFAVTDHWTYLYNGSIHPCAQPVAEAMQSFIQEWACGGEAAFFPAFEAFGKLKAKFAQLVHADARNIVITESTTTAINLAAHILKPQPGQNVLVTDLAFMSNTYPWLAGAAGLGTQVRFVESRDGRIELYHSPPRLDSRFKRLAEMIRAIASNFGVRVPSRRIGRPRRRAGVCGGGSGGWFFPV